VASERPVLLLVHGFPLDSRMWKRQADALSGELEVIAPDLDGHGPAPQGLPQESMEGIVRSLAARLDAAGVGAVHVGGLSMGGYIALAFMRLFPERVKSLILIDTKATADTEAGRQGRDELAAKIGEQGALVAAQAMLPKMFTEEVDEKVRKEAEQWMLEQPPSALVADLKAMRDRPDSTPLLPQISVPTLVVVGEQDPITPPAEAEAMAGAIPGARLVTISGASHLAPVERPDAVNQALADFLA
jgi:pimeloyl-ACP methyl ester carboxylesterase